jgi:hypothetical protein
MYPKNTSETPAIQQLFSNYKYWAKRRQLDFDLKKEQFEFLIKQECFYCGALPSTVCVKRHSSCTYNGIDRKDNRIGYTRENCVPCCYTHNHMKSNKTSEEFIAACRSVVDRADAMSVVS